MARVLRNYQVSDDVSLNASPCKESIGNLPRTVVTPLGEVQSERTGGNRLFIFVEENILPLRSSVNGVYSNPGHAELIEPPNS